MDSTGGSLAEGIRLAEVLGVFGIASDLAMGDDVGRSVRSCAVAVTLVAARESDELRFDVRLQGERETAFFEL